MTDAPADISEKRSISPVWIVPILAALIGVWMVVHTIQSQGPQIEIVFSTAEGIETGKTKIKFRDVEIGLVEDAGLGEDLESVVVHAQIHKEAAPLLREDTQFWVVRPRVGKGGISGLGTVLSGGYIQIAPGTSSQKRLAFVGLEEPPVTPAGTPGVKLQLTADKAGGVGIGDPILYDGYAIGWIESEEFDIETRSMRFGAFVNAPYDDLISTTSRFWNASGIKASAGADGIEIEFGSLETLAIGGIEVGTPEGVGKGRPVEDGMHFRLYPNFAAVNERPFVHSVEYVVSFPQSIRGLVAGAPVEYRGIPVGSVERIMLDELAALVTSETSARPIPVLLRLEPARLERPDTKEGVEQLQAAIASGVPRGLRATLSTGNIITGGLYVAVDFYEGAPPAEIEEFAGRPTIPTIASGLGGLEQRISQLLDTVNDLPLEQTVRELQQTLASLHDLLGSEGMQALPDRIGETLEELQVTAASFSEESELQERLLPTVTELERTLASLRQMLDTLDRQPNALIFNRDHPEDPRPPAGKP
jgi:paraquat-inducible protein B